MSNPTNAPEYEFVTVSDGSIEQDNKIILEEIGENFTGKYLGMRSVGSENGSYQQARWIVENETYFMNANYSLREGLKGVRIGTITRITKADLMDTGQENPMVVYKVEVARVRRNAAQVTMSNKSPEYSDNS